MRPSRSSCFVALAERWPAHHGLRSTDRSNQNRDRGVRAAACSEDLRSSKTRALDSAASAFLGAVVHAAASAPRHVRERGRLRRSPREDLLEQGKRTSRVRPLSHRGARRQSRRRFGNRADSRSSSTPTKEKWTWSATTAGLLLIRDAIKYPEWGTLSTFAGDQPPGSESLLPNSSRTFRKRRNDHPAYSDLGGPATYRGGPRR